MQRDIKAFYSTHRAAVEHARETLFKVGSAEDLVRAAEMAATAGLGVLAADGDYTFHKTSLPRQPALLRLVLGCAERLEPAPEEIDLIKVHPYGGRVSYLCFDDFVLRPLPALVRRIGVDLRRQRIWEQDPAAPADRRLLFGKSRFLAPEFPQYDKQVRFDDRLFLLGAYQHEGLGVSEPILARRLLHAGVRLKGYRILKVT